MKLLSLALVFSLSFVALANSTEKLLSFGAKAATCNSKDGPDCAAGSQVTVGNPSKSAEPKSKGLVESTMDAFKDAWTELQTAMRVQVRFYQKMQPVEPAKLCETYPKLCDSYKLCLKTASAAFEASERSCPLPSQADGVRFYTPSPQSREKKCMAVVLATQLLIKKKDVHGRSFSKSADEPVERDQDVADEVDSSAERRSSNGDHKDSGVASAPRTRRPASTSEPVYEACGEEKSPLTARMDKGKLLPHSVYQITVRAVGDHWVPAQAGDDTECLRVLTDQQGTLRGKMMLSGTAGPNGSTILRSRFLGRQLPNPDGKLLPNRVYDAFTLPGGKQKFIFAACENQVDFRKSLVTLVQSSPTRPKEVQLVGLRFVGEKTDPPKTLAFEEAKPQDVVFSMPEMFASKEVIEQHKLGSTDEAISMAAFVEDK